MGITGQDVVEETAQPVEQLLPLGFGKCALAVQAPVKDGVTDARSLAGKRIVTSFPVLARKFFAQYDGTADAAAGADAPPPAPGATRIKFVSGSVEAYDFLRALGADARLTTGKTSVPGLFGGLTSLQLAARWGKLPLVEHIIKSSLCAVQWQWGRGSQRGQSEETRCTSLCHHRLQLEALVAHLCEEFRSQEDCVQDQRVHLGATLLAFVLLQCGHIQCRLGHIRPSSCSNL